VVKGEEDVVVVFPRLLPRRGILEEAWRGSRRCLWEDTGSGKGAEKRFEDP
jgi:phosphatidylinositol glycan class H protein